MTATGSIVYEQSVPVVDTGTDHGDISVATNSTTTPPAERNPILFRIVEPDPNFIGRWNERETLQSAISSAQKPHVIVVSGMGSVGKTQLIRKFISENRTSYKNFIWINAEKPQLIEEAFNTLATDILKIKTIEAHDLKSVVELVFSELSTTTTLIVYDNVDEKEYVQFLLEMETAGETPHVIITSRIEEWCNNIQKINLKVWEPEEAFEYVTTTLNNLDTHNDKMLLAERLQYFPLALSQATAHINNQRKHSSFQISEYIKTYDSQQMLDSTYFKDDIVLNQYEKTTFTTSMLAIAAIEKFDSIGRLAARILRIIAYFDRDNIRSDIFFHHQLSQDNFDAIRKLTARILSFVAFSGRDNFDRSSQEIDYETKIKFAISLLMDYSMIDCHIASELPHNIFSVHGLVQKLIQIELQRNGQEKSTLRDGLSVLSKLMKHANIYDCQQHTIPVYISALKFKGLVRQFRKMPVKILDELTTKGKYQLAAEFGERILQPLTNMLSDYSYLPETKSRIAMSFVDQGMTAEAHRLYQEVFEKLKEILGEDHPDTLASQHNFAHTCLQMGRYAPAVEIFQEVFEKRKEILGADHPDTLLSQHNIAYTYAEMGKYSEAVEILQNIFKKEKEILGCDHPSTLMTQHSKPP